MVYGKMISEFMVPDVYARDPIEAQPDPITSALSLGYEPTGRLGAVMRQAQDCWNACSEFVGFLRGPCGHQVLCLHHVGLGNSCFQGCTPRVDCDRNAPIFFVGAIPISMLRLLNKLMDCSIHFVSCTWNLTVSVEVATTQLEVLFGCQSPAKLRGSQDRLLSKT